MGQFIKIQALFLSSVLLMFGGGLHGLLTAVRGAEEGFSLLSLGLIGTGWSIGFIAGAVSVPLIVRRVGHNRSYAVMAAIGTITILLNILWVNEIGWIFLRIFSGFCFAGAAMIVESWLNEQSDNKNRGTLFSAYVMANMVASTIGQMFISVTGTAGFVPFLIGAIAMVAALVPTALSTLPQPKPLVNVRPNIRLVFATSPVAIATALAVGMANGSFGTLAPVFAFEKGVSNNQIAILMSVAIICGALSQIPMGRISDGADRRIVILIGAALASATGLALVLLNPEAWMLYLLFAVYGLFAFPIYSVAVAHANDFAGDGEFASVASGMLFTMGIGMALGPFFSAIFMDWWGPQYMFVVSTALHGAVAIFALMRISIKDRPIDESRAAFQPVPVGKGAAPLPLQLDPRNEQE